MQGIKARLFVAMITSIFLTGLAASAAAADPEEWNWTSITSGDMYACATLSSDGGSAFYCFGAYSWGYPLPYQIDHIAPDVFSSVQAGYRHVCGIRAASADLRCYGEVFDQAYVGPWETFSVGFTSICGIKTDGSLWCWGNNMYGQIGNGLREPDAYYQEPQRIGSDTWKSISLGYMHACAIKFDDTLWCWGDNQYGAVGDGAGAPNATTNTPAKIGSATWLSVEAGEKTTCAIKFDDTLWCWGSTENGRLGIGTVAAEAELSPVSIGGSWNSVSVGGAHSCGLKSDMTLWCWGGGDGVGSLSDDPSWRWYSYWSSPTKIGTETYLQVSAGDSLSISNGHTCLLLEDHSVQCKGTFSTTFKDMSGYNLSFDQEISFAEIPDKQVTDADFNLSVSASSSLPVSLTTETTGVCSVSGYTLHIVGAGICIVTAQQDGDGKYAAAVSVSRQLSIRKLSQSITFAALVNKTVLAPAFPLVASSSSGLPISFSSNTTSVCTVNSTTVTIVDIGTCTITASNIGDAIYAGAESVSRSFSITRVLASKKSVTFVDPDGAPAPGITVTWATPDGRYRSSQSATTNAAGQITYTSIPGGQVRFSVSGTVGAWNGSGSTTVLVNAASTRATVGLSSAAGVIDQIIARVRMPDGSGVPSAVVTLSGRYGFPIGSRPRQAQEFCKDGSWMLIGCTTAGVTNLNGDVSFNVVANALGDAECRRVSSCTDPYDYATATFSDGDVTQTSARVQFTTGEAAITVDRLPVVDVLDDDSIVGYATRQTITAVALDSVGDPITGRRLTLSSSVSGATTSSCKSTLIGTTNSVGRVTFKFCPIKTATWSVDGSSIVRSSGVTLTVQRAPTAPRVLVATAKIGATSLAWTAPATVNAGSVTDYVVQYRLQGATTWITFRDGTSTARKATVTGLTSGQVYELRVAAKNKAGTSDWSSVVVATPR